MIVLLDVTTLSPKLSFYLRDMASATSNINVQNYCLLLYV